MEDFLNGWLEFKIEDVDTTRKKCSRCKRPVKACLCQWLPDKKVEPKRSKLIILQHPKEERRPLRTASILQACLSDEFCHIYRGRRFSQLKYAELHSSLQRHPAVLLYPAPEAIPLCKLVSKTRDRRTNILIIDGTWKQAREIYNQNDFLKSLPKVVIDTGVKSEYVIRTQPAEECLSTVECAAIALAQLEGSSISEVLMKPLRAMCQNQLEHGDQVHQPKTKRAKQPESCAIVNFSEPFITPVEQH